MSGYEEMIAKYGEAQKRAAQGSGQAIPAEAVEAAERAAGCVFGNPVSAQEMEGIVKILEAAAPHMLAEACAAGEEAGQDNSDSNRGYAVEHKYNPYRTTK